MANWTAEMHTNLMGKPIEFVVKDNPVAGAGAGTVPRSQKFLLGDRIQGTALAVLESLIEATYTRQRGNHLARALDATGRRIGAWSKAHRARETTQPV